MKYKLICIDMDGTLLNSKHKISDISKKTLIKAHDMGVHIVITTGRTYVDAEAYSDSMGLKSPIIAFTGAVIKEKYGENVIHKSIIDEQMCKELLEIFKKYNVKPIFNSLFKVYCGDLKIKIGMWYLKIRGFLNRNKKKINYLRKELEKVEGIEITSSSKYNIEITKKGTSKGKAIEILADHYNINKEEVIAIGDSENDISAIEFAGMGIAMGNASEEVKKKSNFVTDTNDNDGVAKAIEKFIFKNIDTKM
ncbi:Cof-type HAD-IIB family hydrolase [Clostridium sp.]|uniref:Cof-type HAD-IIB family hydrolase n=1 Tax=Clostridium sp. TaxID=1506 RepID=UPI0028422056|nr:Cof-type HAD-IIB family hydrolase [Clostridium sp.]MDR3597764.1 Cof-type HAD-IIB family hydrolase [Clostridium sp.]